MIRIAFEATTRLPSMILERVWLLKKFTLSITAVARWVVPNDCCSSDVSTVATSDLLSSRFCVTTVVAVENSMTPIPRSWISLNNAWEICPSEVRIASKSAVDALSEPSTSKTTSMKSQSAFVARIQPVVVGVDVGDVDGVVD